MSTTTSSAPAISGEAPPLMREDEKGRSICGTPEQALKGCVIALL